MESRPCLPNVGHLTHCVTSCNWLSFLEPCVTLAVKGVGGPRHFPFPLGISVLCLGSDMALQGPETAARPERPFHLVSRAVGQASRGRSEHRVCSLFRGNAHALICQAVWCCQVPTPTQCD